MSEKPKRGPSAWDDRAAMLRGLHDSGVLRSPADFVEAIDVPMDLAAALATGRKELLSIVRPRAMSEEEVGKLYKLIGVLIDTNFALQAHAREVEQMAATLHQQIRGSIHYAERMAAFAGFRTADDETEES
jgi:hypothetical protein